MATRYEVSIQYDKALDNGLTKRVREVFLVRAETFAQAETLAVTQVNELTTGFAEITAIKKSNISEVARYDGDIWYKCTFKMTTLDDAGKEREEKFIFLVSAATLDEAKDNFHAYMHGTISDYSLVKVEETKITQYVTTFASAIDRIEVSVETESETTNKTDDNEDKGNAVTDSETPDAGRHEADGAGSACAD